MKKLVGISLIAVFAVTPLIASAEDVVLIPETPEWELNHFATTSYVKGAYNVLGGKINTKQDKLTNGTNPVSNVVKTSIAGTAQTASDTSLLTEKAIYDAIDAAKTAAINAASTDNSTVTGRVTSLETAVETIRGTGEGSISYAVGQEAQARADADTVITNQIGNTAMGTQSTTITGAIAEVKGLVSSEASRAAAAETANAEAIDAINNKQISYVTTWGQDATTTVTKKISELPDAPSDNGGDEEEEETGE